MLEERRESGILATVALFATNGLMVGVFGGSLPGLRDLLDLDAGTIGLTLAITGVAAVLAMNVAGRLADRLGARLPSFIGGGVMIVGTVVIGLASSYSVLLVGAVLLGLGNGAMDVAMNALGVHVEKARTRTLMSRFHALFSVGNALGAALVVVLAGLSLRLPLLVAPAVAAVLLVSVWGLTPATPTVEVARGEGGGRVPLFAWFLAAMALCFGLTEGTAIDWSSLHVTDVAEVSPSTGAWGLACVAGFMVVIRLLGDHLVSLWGRARVVGSGSACAMVGYVVVATVGALPLILLGWSLVGLGVGMIAPQIYGMAGHVGGGRVLAIVTSFGYTAFLTGPAIIGFTSAHVGIQHAMLVPLVSAVGLVVLSVRLSRGPGRAAPGS